MTSDHGEAGTEIAVRDRNASVIRNRRDTGDSRDDLERNTVLRQLPRLLTAALAGQSVVATPAGIGLETKDGADQLSKGWPQGRATTFGRWANGRYQYADAELKDGKARQIKSIGFRHDYRDHRPETNVPVFGHLISGVGLRQTARQVGLNAKSVQYKMRKHSRTLALLHANLSPRLPHARTFLMDEEETYETASIRPVTLR